MRIKANTLNLWIFFIAITVQVFTANFESAGLISYLKYIICVFGICVSIPVMTHTSKKLIATDDFKRLLSVPVAFAIITIFKSVQVHTFSQRSLIELLLLALPIVYAFCLINTLSVHQLKYAMMFALIISFTGYLINLHLGPVEIIEELLRSSFSTSTSALESSQYAGVAISLCLYYLFYRRDKFAMILSFLFVIFTFKRLAILTAIIILILPKFIDISKPVNSKVSRLIALIIFILGAAYYFAMIPQNGIILEHKLHINLDDITMGRFWRFSLLYHNPRYVNFGLGSTYVFLMKSWGFALEMDICRLFIEVTFVGVAVFVYQYFMTVKNSWYCTLLMIYLFLNLITSHCLASMFSWLIIYMTIGSIQYLDNKPETGVLLKMKI